MLKKLIPALQDFADKCDTTVCAAHDLMYEIGGTEADRIVADYHLFLGARAACGDLIAVAVFTAVRNIGINHWSTGERWHGGDRAWPTPPEAP
jgi:hypothetical protein